MGDIDELRKEKLLGMIKTEFKQFIDNLEVEYGIKVEKTSSGAYDIFLKETNSLFNKQLITKNVIGKL